MKGYYFFIKYQNQVYYPYVIFPCIFYQNNFFEELYLKARHYIIWHSTVNCLRNLLTQSPYSNDQPIFTTAQMI